LSVEDDYALAFDVSGKEVTDEIRKRCLGRAKIMLRDLKRVNPRQFDLVTDPAFHIAGLCPRRAGKSYAAAAAALIQGEAHPGSISIIISLNKQQLRRIYWSGGPSGLVRLAIDYKLKLEFNNTYLRWTHENGSIGYLLGCEDDEQMEVIRGLEANLYIIDECKSFPPQKLNTLIDDIIDPQRGSRDARLMLIGTPGFIPAGPFYEATCRENKDEDGLPTALPFGEKDPAGRTANGDLLWSLHEWTLQDNRAKPGQWVAAQLKKKQKKWKDDHPTWLREYMGKWTITSEGMVYAYSVHKDTCTWKPETTNTNPTGLPKDGGQWRLIAGLDIGFEAPTALVVLAYSSVYRQLRHIVDFSKKHMLPHEIAALYYRVERQYGKIEVVYADMANLGVAMAQELMDEYHLPLEKAEKRNKNDYIEMLNSAFSLGEVLIIPGTALEHQLLTSAWDIDEEFEVKGKHALSAKENMARLSKLVADKSIPDDSTDALLYAYRGSLHRFGKTKKEAAVEVGTVAYYNAKERKALEDFRFELRKEEQEAKLAKLRNSLPKVPSFLRAAMQRKDTWTHRPRLN
jgi:terminase large subunit-like protein